VTLSPKATNVVAPIFGGIVTVTLKEQDAVTFLASVAVHATRVTPVLNTEPFAGEHTTCAGGVPPLDVTDGYTTGIGIPVLD
jgi:hypothetical protein